MYYDDAIARVDRLATNANVQLAHYKANGGDEETFLSYHVGAYMAEANCYPTSTIGFQMGLAVWQLAQARQEIEKLKEDLAMRDAVIANFDVLGQL